MTSRKEQEGFKSAYLVFVDMVGYAKLPLDEQSQKLRALERLAIDTKAVQDAKGDFIPSSSGDGFVLAFFTNFESPLLCAIEISEKLRSYSDILIRIGLHSGPVEIGEDIAKKPNVTGDGVNDASRVMDCGDAGHILASDDLVKVLSRISRWQGCFQDLGEVADKHGKHHHLHNFHNDKVGNPAIPKKVRAQREAADDGQRVIAVNPIPHDDEIDFVRRRDAEGKDIVECLRERLTPTGNKSVSLYGPGGIGKSRLAREAGRELWESFAGRVLWNSAEGRAEFALSTLLDDIAAQLGQGEAVRPLPLDRKEAVVRALVAEKPTLVLLDNYETIKPEAKPHLEEWFSRAGCSALITSRQKVKGTHGVKVEAMSPEEAEEFLTNVIGQTMDAEMFSAEVRQRVYEAAEHNPFVMQWVVGQIDEAREPQVVFAELRQGAGDAAERVFARSFNLLNDDGKAALLALTLFAPSASRNALASVAGFGDDATRMDAALKSLRGLWLIKPLDGNSRFTLEGLTRSIAAAQLSKDPRAAELRGHFVAHFLSYAEAHAQKTPEDFAALEAEKENVLGAMDVAFALEDWESVLCVCYATGDFLDLRGYWDEAIQRGELGLKAARSAQAENQIAGVSHNLAMMYQGRGELKEARRLYTESIEISRQLGDQSGIASTTSQLGIVHYALGEFAESKAKHEESLAIRRKLGEQQSIAIDLHQLAMLAQAQGELEEARRLYTESMEIKQRLGDQRGIASTLHQLGWLAQAQDELEEARRLYTESMEIKQRLGDQRGIAITLHQLAMLAQAQGELEEARRLYTESMEIKQRLGDQRGIAITLGQLGLLVEQEGDCAEAVKLTREALIIFEKLKSPYAEVARRNLEILEGKSPEPESES